jgi:hypothetical protein
MGPLSQNQIQAIAISALAHICLWLLIMILPAPPQKTLPQNVEIVYRDKNENQQQIVTDSAPDLKEALKKLDDQVKRLSRVTRRVVKEQIAAKSGPAQNANHSNRSFDPRTELPHPSPPAQALQVDDSAYAKPSISAPMPGHNVAREARMGDSTIPDFIPEVKVGGFTALNQDQFLYYTFYSRINEQIRNRWLDNLRTVLNDSPRTQVNRWSERPQIGEFEVLLTPDGRYLKTVLYRHADASIIDEAAVSAFRLAAPFNNPPSEIVESDGLIHLHYLFHLEFRPSLVASGAH